MIDRILELLVQGYDAIKKLVQRRNQANQDAIRDQLREAEAREAEIAKRRGETP